jgi:hypothetical protein
MTTGATPSQATSPSRPLLAGAGGRVPLVGGARLPLAFIGGGLVALGVGAVWTVVAVWGGPLPFVHPQVVALAHVWLPGFLLSVCLGASYQLMPVVLGVPLRAGLPSLWVHAGLHAAGVMALATGLARGHYVLAGIGGMALVAGVARFGVATLATFAVSPRRDAAAWSFPFAAVWLFATVNAGVLLAANRHAPFLPLSVLDLLKAHAHLGLVGYFLSLLQGVTFQLVPMFTMGTPARPRWAVAGLLATQAGLPLLVGGLAFGETTALRLGTGLVLGGLCGSGLALTATLRSRRRRVLDPGVRAFVLGAALLAVAAAWGGALVFGWVPSGRLAAAAWTYGALAVGGGLSLCVLGMLCKILPFLVWMKAYGPRVGREPVPVATALASRKLEYSWLGAHAGGLALLAAGLMAEAGPVAVVGGVLLAVGVACYLASAVRVAAHLWSNPAERRRRQNRTAAPALLSSL